MYRGGSRIRPKKIRKMPSGRYRYKNLLFQFRPEGKQFHRRRLRSSWVHEHNSSKRGGSPWQVAQPTRHTSVACPQALATCFGRLNSLQRDLKHGNKVKGVNNFTGILQFCLRKKNHLQCHPLQCFSSARQAKTSVVLKHDRTTTALLGEPQPLHLKPGHLKMAFSAPFLV